LRSRFGFSTVEEKPKPTYCQDILVALRFASSSRQLPAHSRASTLTFIHRSFLC
jgi:hypothetical protein